MVVGSTTHFFNRTPKTEELGKLAAAILQSILPITFQRTVGRCVLNDWTSMVKFCSLDFFNCKTWKFLHVTESLFVYCKTSKKKTEISTMYTHPFRSFRFHLPINVLVFFPLGLCRELQTVPPTAFGRWGLSLQKKIKRTVWMLRKVRGLHFWWPSSKWWKGSGFMGFIFFRGRKQKYLKLI